MQKSDWWKDFFSGVVLEMWRGAISEEQTHAEADFIGKQLELRPPAKMLDIPCGNGRLSIDLASRGFQMTGVDFSRDFLEEAQCLSDRRQLKIVWERREMRQLQWQQEFDGAFCFGNSFGFLDDVGNVDFLKTVYRVLKPGARFVLDAGSVAENILPKLQDRSWAHIGEILFLEENSYDHIRSRLDTEYTFISKGSMEKRFGSHRIYTCSELYRMLNEVGFVDCKGYGSLDCAPFKFGAEKFLLVASKKGE